MRNIFFFFFFITFISFSQEIDTTKVTSVKADISLYKIYNLRKDTIVVDTSLTIQDEYRYNYLRKDIFGLLPFSNEGYLYTQMDFSKKKSYLFPQFGFNAKHISYLDYNEINYYNVPTPLTDLYFKTVMRQGQSLDALLSLNTQRNLNFTVAYKAVRSVGDYFNNLTSSGHFRFMASYFSPNRKYFLNAHFVGQDIFNQENGGLSDVTQFENNEPSFRQRERIDVFFTDASSKLKGNRFFIDHNYRFKSSNSLVLKHQAYYETKFYEYIQNSPSSRLGNTNYFLINNKTRNDVFFNRFDLSYSTNKFGELSFFIDNSVINHYFVNQPTYQLNVLFPSNIQTTINTLGVQYLVTKSKWNFNLLAQNAISNKPTSNYLGVIKYKFNELTTFEAELNHISRIPDNNYLLNQSSYDNYNWYNSFKNEKESSVKFKANTKWVTISGQYSILKDKMYFYNTVESLDSLVVKPFQYNKTIQYYTLELAREFKFKKFALDNRIKFQDVKQENKILNVPYIITRNTLYYMNHVFNKAMLLQTGITFNYFTKYYSDDYNPLLGDFYVQKESKIGGFPMFDLFVNARVRQVRIYLKAEHFNTLFGTRDYFNTPNYPYHDFKVRFGLEWNFFK